MAVHYPCWWIWAQSLPLQSTTGGVQIRRSPRYRKQAVSVYAIPSLSLRPKFKSRWTAICRGAVVHGLTNMGLSPSLHVSVGARIARINYGVKYEAPWIEGEHRECNKVWCEKEYEYRAWDQMEWFLTQVSLTIRGGGHGAYRFLG